MYFGLSKVLLYEFNYDYIKNEYDNDWILLFTETDSLMYEIKTEVVYETFISDFKTGGVATETFVR